jgi:glycerophosphoryl diester phosphodiesterase
MQALRDGADALECDVRLTADQHLVCVHDRRLERTSNGKGVLSTLPLGELEQLDFSSWKKPWSDLDDEAEDIESDTRSILTLDRLCAMVADWGRPVEIAIETKHPTRYAGVVERRLVETLHRFGWVHPPAGTVSPVRVMSFSWLSIRRIQDLAPSTRTVFLMERIPLRFRDGSLPMGVAIAGPSIEAVRAHPNYVSRVHGHGSSVHVWTVNDRQDIALCADLGVEAIITDRPGPALRQVSSDLNGRGSGG